jgi:TetR/AcrR family transcriptional regulator, cholesterol catabolism regulator
MPEAKSSLTHAQQARRDRIVEAGLALLAERDYDKIQVKDVAEEANVALGTLYHYFSSKEHLFAEVLVRWAGTLRTNISRNPLRGTTDTQRLTQVINRSVRAFQRQPSLARLVATLETSADPYATEILARLAETTNDIYLEAIQDVDRDTAQRIVGVIDAVLASRLRSWIAGRISITAVSDDLTDAIAFLLDPESRGAGVRQTARS